MSTLVLGGTAWLGREVVSAALERGEDVTVLARGQSGPLPAGVDSIRADRADPGAYEQVSARDWDAVVDVSRQPSQVASALAALGERTAAWVFVSSSSVYARADEPGADESAERLAPHREDDDGWETYGGRKVACEDLVLAAVGDRALVARSGLIGGPGDHSDRTGYWPLRFAHPATPEGGVLVPDSTVSTQVIDVRDLAAWLVDCAVGHRTGVVNAVGPVVPLTEHLAAARAVAGHQGELVGVEPEWLVDQGVEAWSGPRSLPLWLPVPEYAGFAARRCDAAQALGLRSRPLVETLTDTLAWELQSGPGRTRKAGLAPADEAELIRLARA
ncbi:MAG TPA: NAD-dependent epimerase/dehydratase family protein [Pedococcus sp.]|jgi:nucleoside-diphosphate-sugar epimerase|nr:NAD-dependent epimerase/dehydratase family protein [Pedococcus sp.]